MLRRELTFCEGDDVGIWNTSERLMRDSYTPAFVAGTNMTSVAISGGDWLFEITQGGIITIHGRFISNTVTAGLSDFTITLPPVFDFDFTSVDQSWGVCNWDNGDAGAIRSVVGTRTVRVDCNPESAAPLQIGLAMIYGRLD